MPNKPGSNKSKTALPAITPFIQTAELERREFLKLACTAAAGLFLAGSLGTLTGCGIKTSNTVDSGTAVETVAPQSSDSSNTQGDSACSDNEPDCRFNNDGICSKTGNPCTNCIETQ
ncbi:MAG: twin-arginine translocation signal domain-containing protein [Actinobacteria bacterium]|nr:twin-arginine translocation signal domain-containing protein [Actinomycetota bacterium]